MLEAETGVETVTIGKYNKAKDIVVVAADSGYQNFGDLPEGCKVGVESFGGSTIVWIALAKDLHNRTLGEGPGDLQMAATDFNTAPELVLSGDLCAGVTSIYNSMPYLMDGSVTGLYDTQSASQIYGEQYVPGHEGMDSNNFVVLKSWYDTHPGELPSSCRYGSEGWKSGRTTRTPSSRPIPTTSDTPTTMNWHSSRTGIKRNSTNSLTAYTWTRPGSRVKSRSRTF